MSGNYLTNLIPNINDEILAYRFFDNQVAIVDLAQGTLSLLNVTASRIWQLLGEGNTIEDIAKKISQEFDVSFKEVISDVQEVFLEMVARGWIKDFSLASGSHAITSSYSTDIFETLREQAVQKQIPLVVHIDLTYRCNLKCVHCYLTGGKKQLECSTDEIKDILEQLAEAGALYITLSGGEIFLRKDLPEIVRHARRLHFAVRLLTSGTLIDEGMVEEIVQWHPELVAFSVYDLNPEIHDAITKVKGSLFRTLKIISLLKERGVPIKISSVLMQNNINGYRRLYSFAKEIGAQFQLDYRITPKTDGSKDPLLYHITDQQAMQVLSDQIFLGEYESDPDPIQGYSGVFNEIPCGAAHMSCYISPYGIVTPCVQVPIECGDLRERSFSEIWKNSPGLNAFRAVRFSDMPKCFNCRFFSYCRPCPGLNLVETGNLFTPPLRVCKEAKHMKILNKKRR